MSADVAQLVERDLPKVDVASSNLVIRSTAGQRRVSVTWRLKPSAVFQRARGRYGDVVQFTGFPVAALDFYDDLEVENTKVFWDAHKHVYKQAVREPFEALMAALEPQFGQAKIFRPYRDVRFSKDKLPYKTHQGAFVRVADATGWYFELSPRGTRVGAGFYDASGPRLARVREAMVDEEYGAELEGLLARYAADGWEIGGDRLKTAPRGFSKDHPRIELLRHKQLFVGRPYGFEDDALNADLVDRVRADWEELRPLLTWLTSRPKPD